MYIYTARVTALPNFILIFIVIVISRVYSRFISHHHNFSLNALGGRGDSNTWVPSKHVTQFGLGVWPPIPNIFGLGVWPPIANIF